MGQSTDAYLFYGFSLDEGELDEMFEELYPDGYTVEENLEAWVAEKTGGPAIPAWYLDDTPWEETDKVLRDNYCDKKGKHLQSSKVGIDSHQSCDVPVYFVCIKTTLAKARRGYPHSFGKFLPVAAQEGHDSLLGRDALISHFCEMTGIRFREPTWLLASMWC